MFNLRDKLFFNKITGRSNQLAVTSSALEDAVLNDCFYFFCGLNTTNIKYCSEKDIAANPAFKNLYILDVIKKQSWRIKTFEKFIFENEYSSDSLKRIISNEMENALNKFYVFLASLQGQVRSIE